MSILRELAEASGSNKLSDQMILLFQREIAKDLQEIEEMTKVCKEMNNVSDMPEIPASEVGLAYLRMRQNRDVEKAKLIMQIVNETEASIRLKTAFIEQLRNK